MDSKRSWQDAQSFHGSTSNGGHFTEGRNGHKHSSLTQKQSPNDIHFQIKNNFSPGNDKPLLRADPRLKEDSQQKMTELSSLQVLHLMFSLGMLLYTLHPLNIYLGLELWVFIGFLSAQIMCL